MTKAPTQRIAIVGGGISGLYCALVLGQQGKSVDLFETSDRLGGRIRTLRLDKQNKPMKENWNEDELEFYVEFGPMRVELDKQLLLKSLLTYLGIRRRSNQGSESNKCYLVDFPAYASPVSEHDPQYELRPEEVGKTPLELLRMALLRVTAHLEVETSEFQSKKKKLIEGITLAAATQESADQIFVNWVKNDLEPTDLWDIQRFGEIAGVPLYAMGFWNLLSDYLSHNAISKLRDLGTFYHLLPENPNAAEWYVWWLIGFSITDKLQGIFGGMECIIDKLTKKLAGQPPMTDCWVKGLELTDKKKFRLIFDKEKRPKGKNSGVVHHEYDHVILALPKSALRDFERSSPGAFQAEPKFGKLLGSSFGFPMVKTFVVVAKRWWEEENRANRYATRVPTRELHYWKGHSKDSKQGLIMSYTDRPASSFWANYVPPGPQIDVNRSGDRNHALHKDFEERLKKKVAHYLNENNAPEVTVDDIVWYGIRDWGRDPYGGANHAWRPERKYWVVMRRLAEIADPDSNQPIVHICGEAYSDYHGFIEGALRSAVYVLHRILDRKADGTFESLPWLVEEKKSAAAKNVLIVEEKYLMALRKWASNLDSIEQRAEYKYVPGSK